MKNMAGIRCKAYSLPGIGGGEVTFAETIDRKSIRISAAGKDSAPVNLWITAEQFEAMCGSGGFASCYDGLEVKASQPSEEGAIIVTPDEEPEPDLGEGPDLSEEAVVVISRSAG